MEEGTWGQNLWYGTGNTPGLQTFLIALFAIVGALAGGYAIFLGINLAKAEDEGKRKQAKGRIMKAVAGLFIVVLLVSVMVVPGSNGFLGTILVGTKDMNVYEMLPGHVRLEEVDAAQGKSMPILLFRNGTRVTAADNFTFSSAGLTINGDGTFSGSAPGFFTVSVHRNGTHFFDSQILITPTLVLTPPPPVFAPPPPPPRDFEQPPTSRTILPLYTRTAVIFPPGVGEPHVRIPRPANAPTELRPHRPRESSFGQSETWTEGWVNRRVWLSPNVSLDRHHEAAGGATEVTITMLIANEITRYLEFWGVNWGMRSLASVLEDEERPGTQRGMQMSISESNIFWSDIYISIGTNVGGSAAWNGPGPGISRGNMAFSPLPSVPNDDYSYYSWGLSWSILSNIDHLYRNGSGLMPNGGRNDFPLPIFPGDDEWDPYVTNATPPDSIENEGTVNAPSTIMRNGFRDNAQDAIWIRNNIQLIARAYAIGICLRLGFLPEPLI
jgi:hypothetical protein